MVCAHTAGEAGGSYFCPLALCMGGIVIFLLYDAFAVTGHDTFLGINNSDTLTVHIPIADTTTAVGEQMPFA